jgi:hypothetical protein
MNNENFSLEEQLKILHKDISKLEQKERNCEKERKDFLDLVHEKRSLRNDLYVEMLTTDNTLSNIVWVSHFDRGEFYLESFGWQPYEEFFDPVDSGPICLDDGVTLSFSIRDMSNPNDSIFVDVATIEFDSSSTAVRFVKEWGIDYSEEDSEYIEEEIINLEERADSLKKLKK